MVVSWTLVYSIVGLVELDELVKLVELDELAELSEPDGVSEVATAERSSQWYASSTVKWVDEHALAKTARKAKNMLFPFDISLFRFIAISVYRFFDLSLFRFFGLSLLYLSESYDLPYFFYGFLCACGRRFGSFAHDTVQQYIIGRICDDLLSNRS